MVVNDALAVADYVEQAHEFLARSREYLDAGDLHQASEKGWGAAAHMAKAVAEAQGWEYRTHADFSKVLSHARRVTGDVRLRSLRSYANELHSHYYKRKRELDAEDIAEDIESMAELLDILAPLTQPR